MWLLGCNQRYKPQTCSDKATIINKFMQWLKKDLLIKDISTIILENFLNELPGKTANRHKRELKTLFSFAVKRNIISVNPLIVIEPFKEVVFKRYVPPSEDIQAIMDIADPLQEQILVFAYHTLARAGEIRACLWSDVDFENETITLWTSKTRDGNPADDTLEMTETLKRMLQGIKRINDHVFNFNGEPLKRYFVYNMVPFLAKKAGAPHFSAHCIRHHVASLLAYKLSLIEISKILRHKNLTTTDIYLRSLVKIETKGIRILDDISKPTSGNIIPFFKAANGTKTP